MDDAKCPRRLGVTAVSVMHRSFMAVAVAVAAAVIHYPTSRKLYAEISSVMSLISIPTVAVIVALVAVR